MDMVGPMLTVKESMLTDGTVAEPAAGDEAAAEDAGADEVDELDEDEQPAAVRARAAATATQAARGKRRNLPSPCEREPRPPSLLSPSVIPPYPFQVKASEYADAGTCLDGAAPSAAVGPSAGRPRVSFIRP
jgi:hypothetical protein